MDAGATGSIDGTGGVLATSTATTIAQGQSHAVDVPGSSNGQEEGKETGTPTGEEGAVEQLNCGGGGDDLDVGVSLSSHTSGGGPVSADAGVGLLRRGPEGRGSVAPSVTGSPDDTAEGDGPDPEEKDDQVEDQSEVGEVVHIWTPC